MLGIARQARSRLPEAADRVAAFLQAQAAPDGGFRDRSGKSDLYYTVFGLLARMAIEDGPPPPAVRQALRRYVEPFGGGGALDFVHLSCLARCWAIALDPREAPDIAAGILGRMETFRSADGGYHATLGSATGSVYACFLALGTYQDLVGEVPDPDGLLRCVKSLRTEDGAFANERGLKLGLTPATAAALVLMRELGQPIPAEAAEWLWARMHPDGGFFATPEIPIPDLLSTATALRALACANVPLVGNAADRCANFVRGLYQDGGFCGHPFDSDPDCEYTFYGLLALGLLGGQP
jgi:prenyltransferase beta subunit